MSEGGDGAGWEHILQIGAASYVRGVAYFFVKLCLSQFVGRMTEGKSINKHFNKRQVHHPAAHKPRGAAEMFDNIDLEISQHETVVIITASK